MFFRFLIAALLYLQVSITSAQTDSIRHYLESLPADTLRVNVLNRLAQRYAISDPLWSTNYINQARELALTLNYPEGVLQSYFNESLLLKQRDLYPQQLQVLIKALRIAEQLNVKSWIAAIYTEMAIAMQQQGDVPTARTYFDKALVMHQQLGDRRQEAIIYRRIGILYNDSLELARDYYERSLAIMQSLNDTEGIANAYNNLGVTHNENGKYAEALEYFTRSLALQKQINNLVRLPAAHFNLGQLYLNMGNPGEALKYAQKGLPLARATDNRMSVLELTKLHADAYEQLQDHPKALYYLRQHLAIKDSVMGQENGRLYAEVKELIEREQREMELALANQREQAERKQRKFAWSAFVVLSVLAGFGIYQHRKIIQQKELLLNTSKDLHASEQSRTQAELQNEQLKQQQLTSDLEHRHKELLIYTLNLAQKNALMENLREGIADLLQDIPAGSKVKFNRLIKLIDYSLETEKDWEEFRMYFEKVHSSFFDRLKEKFPDLTQSDLKLCALISLNLSMKECAELMAISAESVKMARHRLRKKLDLPTEENLTEFIASFK